MGASFDAVWPDLAPHLSPLLVPPAHHPWLRDFLSFTPCMASDFLGFEARLGKFDGATDCALNLTSAAIAWLFDPASRADRGLAGAEWDRIRSFLALWQASGEPPLGDMTRVWLEFDMAAAPAMRPNLMFGYWPRGHEAARDRAWLIDQAIPAALGAPLPDVTASLFARGLDACPGADDFQIGLMTARAVPAVRLCVFDLPDREVRSYLGAIGWPGDADRLVALVRAFRPHADFVGLHFDFAGKALPHVGIEPGFTASSWSRQPHREPRWRGLLDVLGDLGALTAGKRAALLGWTGHGRVTLDSRDMVLLRGLSHLKLVLRDDGSLEAKAYFGIAVRNLAEGLAGAGGRDAAAA